MTAPLAASRTVLAVPVASLAVPVALLAASRALLVAVAVLAVPVATALLVRTGALAARPTSARRNAAWFGLVLGAFLLAPGGPSPGAVALAVALVALFEGTLLGLRRGAPFRNHFR